MLAAGVHQLDGCASKLEWPHWMAVLAAGVASCMAVLAAGVALLDGCTSSWSGRTAWLC